MLKEATNIHFKVGEFDVPTEHLTLMVEVESKYVGKELTLSFQSSKIFADSRHTRHANCMKLYLEIEVVSGKPLCKALQTSVPQISIQSVPKEGLHVGRERNQIYSVASEQRPFFKAYDLTLDPPSSSRLLAQTSQPRGNSEHDTELSDEELEDFYEGYYLESQDFDEFIASENFTDFAYDKYGNDTEWLSEDIYEFRLRLMQKFMQENAVSFVLERDPEPGTPNLAKGPTCNDVCIVGGEMSFNEFSTFRLFPSGTRLRLWLWQEKPMKCSEFQLEISIKRLNHEEENKEEKRLEHLSSATHSCDALELPQSLNTPKYLDQPGGFHYKENFRIDNLFTEDKEHSVHFVIKEDFLFRFVGLVHSHLEFDLMLQKLVEEKAPQTLARSTAKNFEDSIFMQL